jgi:leader peptidase (prepilin peptidase) / N-methyltransferase
VTSQEIFAVVASGVFGSMIGSFLNVVIHRLPQDGRSVLNPRRSECPGCNHEIAWYDNLPVVSWLVLRGRCRSCGTWISLRYPIVELLTAGLFALVTWKFVVESRGGVGDLGAWMHAAAGAAFVCALVVATFIDLAHTIIPDRITLRGMIIAPFVCAMAPQLQQTDKWLPELQTRPAALVLSLCGVVVGAGSIWLTGVLGSIMFRKRALEHGGAMGLGDVKFMGLLGGIVGPVGVLLTLFLACVFGTIYGIPRMVIMRKHWMPFGPFLSLGALLLLLFRDEIMHIIEVDLTRGLLF